MKYDELVKALRQCVTKGDLITICDGCPYKAEIGVDCENNLHKDAAAAIEALQALLTEADKKQAYQHDCICELVAEVEELKAAQPKRGEWLNVTDSYHWYGKCSVCGEEFVVDAYYAGGMNYCPNCGARMEVQE